ncbi:hypothetical protein CY35_06G017200 [Sphagnum magellanicum]|nr:hypothetical protein CY35_06G017200 [Sphagnum magellanicum]KAH9558620.1 hypothetical protein CY35_06G017200 [Sphagnum magellanicum]KAH9558624.1 hypothetical protein CY35_06G017200 [Sphagnum magellanicum]KAH9558625.1 hypothetical protein CY35_06G017200 [Sphagnum magellanicum]KAH9558626.1 hypothetical protein CY35_06G017200 [Sphagnum magellanicum]
MFSTKFSRSKAPPSSSHASVQLVHQLWPRKDNVSCIDFDIVFFHGVRKPGETDAWKNTWVQHTSAQEFWVKDWLPEDLDGNVRVLALSYDSCAIQSNNEGNLQDVADLGSDLLQSLVFSDPWRLGQQWGCVLVGHSFGGLVIKSLVVEAYQRAQVIPRNRIDELSVASANRFLKNLRGVVNYAVPHTGSCLESYFTVRDNLFRRVNLAEFMKNLQPSQRRMEDLSVKFDEIVQQNSILVYAFLEGKHLKDLGKKMVEDTSARRGANNNYILLEDCDHFTVCKPFDKFHPSYYKLVEFIRSCQQEDSLWRHPSFSSEVPQKLPNIIEGVSSQYLDLAANSLKDVQILISPQSVNPIPMINELQCQYLLEKFCDTLTGAKACIQDASLQHIQESHDTLKSLARLAKEAEKLVHDCCDAEWIQAAMIFANAKEHFASLTFKLRLYMELLQSIFKEGATKEFLTKLQDPKWIDDVKDEEYHFIDEKAKEDRQRLLSRLMHVGSSDSENLIRRLQVSSNRATFLQDNATSVIDAWKVEYKSIHRVPNGQIGKGGSATVHKVTWLGKDFAEKCFHGPENEDIQEEASLLAGLSHPNILPLFCYATRDHSCSLIMELMDGDLHQLMERLVNNESQDAPFELLEAVDIMLQVAEGMNYLHQNRVVHRDLKSMNILVKYNEHDRHVYAKVADFGLSRIKELSCTYSNLTMDLGTTRWMAPELFRDSEDHNVGPSSPSKSLKYHFKVDVYSFGMVCYEILTGCVPFFNFKLMDLRKRIKDGLRPDMPEQCPEQLSTLVQACYHRDPKARPSFPDICVELRHIMCSLMLVSTS